MTDTSIHSRQPDSISGHLAALVRNSQIRYLFISAVLIVTLSFFRTFIAGTIRVDGHGLSGIPVFIVFFGFLIGLGAYTFSAYKLWRDGDMSLSTIRLLAFILAALFSLMLPMMSNDLYSLLTYGDAANRGVDVYIDVLSLIRSPYSDYVSPLWKTAPCVYGPVSLSTSRLACLIGGGNILLSIAAYKALAFIWALLLIEVSFRIAKLLKTSVRPFMFIVLNPVFLLQGVGQLHCDMLAITLCLCMLYFYFLERWYLAFLFAGLAICAKMSFVIILGFIVVALFLERGTWVSFIYKTVGGLCITFVTVFVLYYPSYTSPDTFRVPFNFLFKQNPAKSIAEVIGDIVYFAPSVISGHNDELNATMAKSNGVSDPQLAVWTGVKKACQIFAFLLSGFIFIRYWFGKRESQQWMNIYLRFVLIFLLFYSHVFYAWYLMILLPFVWYETDIRFMQWLFVLTSFSNVHDIMCAVNRGTPVYFMVLPLTLFSVLVFFWRFRNNFFTSLNQIVPANFTEIRE